MQRILVAVALSSWIISPAHADAAEWKGEGSVTAGLNTGNTDTSDLGIGIKLGRKSQLWRHQGELLADYGTKNGSQTKNRIFVSGQSDRIVNDDLFAFGRVSHEEDEFSGFNSRSFVGAGLGWQLLDSEAVSWSLEGGSGLRVDRVRARTVELEAGGSYEVPANTKDPVAISAASRLFYQINEQVSTGNETSVIYAAASTQISNKATLTAGLMKGLSARFSFEVRHDTHPQ